MLRHRAHLLALLAVAGCTPPATSVPTPGPSATPSGLADPRETHLANVRQLTFGADNAEAYWSFAGDALIMQTNHAPYGCDQIEVLPIGGGPARLVSTGLGRTTCSYFLPGDQEIVYASTHESSGKCPDPPDMSQGYYWGLFEYDIYRAAADGSNLRRLTDTPGYDAEATVCAKDGSIVFTSVRDGDLELYRMDGDGKNVVRLTHAPGYDGGAFYSTDCSRIVWRASRPEGAELEAYRALLDQKLVKPTKMSLYVANADGTDARRVTYLPGASFAPFFFPSGQRILFASNYLAPRGPEFDLFAIDVDGGHLERITFADGFDGFPMFSPDGQHLAFSSNRRDVARAADGSEVYRVTGTAASPHDTNVFVADWIDPPPGSARPSSPETVAADRFAADVRWLADDAREGRDVGSEGLEQAMGYVEAALAASGAAPAFGERFRQPFEVVTAVERLPATVLAIDEVAIVASEFVPLAFSASATASGPVVAVGWGIEEPNLGRNDFEGKNLKGKIALVHRFAPGSLAPADVRRLGDLRLKAFAARQKGAVGLLVVDDGDPKEEEAKLPDLAPTGAGDAGIPVAVITRAAASKLARGRHQVALTVALAPVRSPTANVAGVIRAGAAAKHPGVVVVGAHVDHLGMGGPNALDSEPGIHNGADDNASGVAGLLEVARMLGARQAELARDVYLVAFSGEERGVLGSAHFVKHLPSSEPVVAMLNMDMIGRMRMNELRVLGGKTAEEWPALVGPSCAHADVRCSLGGSGYGPSDHMPFYTAGVPVLYFFTGSHLDYHTVHDDADRINAAGGARVAAIVAELVGAVAAHAPPPTYVKAPPEPTSDGDVRRRGASLGTVPSYDEDPSKPPGMVVSDVVPGGPAADAGMRSGDRIVAVGGVEIRDVHDLMFVLQVARPGQATHITYVRDGQLTTVDAVFGVPRGRH